MSKAFHALEHPSLSCHEQRLSSHVPYSSRKRVYQSLVFPSFETGLDQQQYCRSEVPIRMKEKYAADLLLRACACQI